MKKATAKSLLIIAALSATILSFTGRYRDYREEAAVWQSLENLTHFSVYEIEVPMITGVVGSRQVIDCRTTGLPVVFIYYASDSSEADLMAYRNTLMQDFGWQDMTGVYPRASGDSLHEEFILEHNCMELEEPIQISAIITNRGYAIKVDPVEIRVIDKEDTRMS